MYDEVRFVYLLLHFFMLICFFSIGRFISNIKGSHQYWKVAICLILVYAIVEGLRWGHMIDWNLYCKRYQEIGEGISLDEYEYLFYGICYLFYNMGFPYWFFVFVQCAFLMFALCFLFQDFKKEALFVFPFIPYLIHNNENFIRWYLGISFVLLSFYYVQYSKYKVTIVLLVCAVCVHVGTVVFFPFIFLRDVLNRIIINKYIAVGCLVGVFFASLSSLDILVGISQLLLKLGIGGLHPRLAFWLESTDLLVSGDLGTMGVVEQRTSTQFRYFIEYAPILYFSLKYLGRYRYGYFFYNLTFIGAVLSPLFSMVEVLGRITEFFQIFTAIVGGITFYHAFKTAKESIYTKTLCLISFVCAVWPIISFYLFFKSDIYDMTYIWDSNGRDYLPFE